MLTIVEMAPGSSISCTRELKRRGYVYCATDKRMQFMILGQTPTSVRDVIMRVVGEDISLTSLYDASKGLLKKGFAGSFRVERVGIEDLPQYTKGESGLYKRVLIGTSAPFRWKCLRADAPTSKSLVRGLSDTCRRPDHNPQPQTGSPSNASRSLLRPTPPVAYK
jgi:hypothetical protein